MKHANLTKLNFPKLYAITDSHSMPGASFLIKAEAALKGGCRLIQYRDKSADTEKRFVEASQLQALCQQYQALLIINDDIELAKRVNAAGVHLGQGDASIEQAREILGADAIVGITCHDQITLARAAEAAGASYIAFGRFFNSSTKPGAKAAPLELLKQASAEFQRPIVAIGGICRDNASQVINAGADSIAVSHGIFGDDDCNHAAQQLLALF